MKLLTYNTHLFSPWLQLVEYFRVKPILKDDQTRCELITRAIRDSNADIVGLTEVWYEPYADHIVKGLRGVYPYSFRPKTGYTSLKLTGSGLLLLSKTPFESTFTPYNTSAGEDYLAQKGFIRAVHRNAVIYLTHIQAGYKNDEYMTERLANIKQIVEAIEAETGKVICMGDFNVDQHSLLHSILDCNMLLKELKDVGKGTENTVDPDNTLHLLFGDHRKETRLDYIFVPKSWRVEYCYSKPKSLEPDIFQSYYQYIDDSFEVHDLSDHYPVCAKVILE